MRFTALLAATTACVLVGAVGAALAAERVRYLPGARENFEVVGEYQASAPFGDVKLGQVADVSVHKGFAYLNYWDDEENSCQQRARGGIEVVDINDPARPKHVAFLPAKFPYYHGEGAHTVSLNTLRFQGDLLAVNDETYRACGPEDKRGGGFDLYDVTNPREPKLLVQGAGDTDGTRDKANSSHSVFVWEDNRRAYLVATDNIEPSDVDIFDITDPANPVQIGDYDLREMFPSILDGEEGNGQWFYHHDMVVKRIGGRMVMLSNYWDAGYVQLNVSNPREPKLITDTRFSGHDPLSGVEWQEGNAHQGEFSADNQFFLAADEDFAPYPTAARITQAPFAGRQWGGALSDAEEIPEDSTISGGTRFVGFACEMLEAAPPGVTAALAERGGPNGGCPFQDKVENIQAAGYELAIVFNNGEGAEPRCDGVIGMLLDPAAVTIPSVFVARSTAFQIMGVYDEATYHCVTDDPANTPVPAAPADGLTIEITRKFDGWGYAHLYDARTSEEIDAFAIPEAMDRRYATGFGDLSIHEFATDPTEPVAYSSYYAGGVRAFTFSRAEGLRQTGKFISDRGSNVWGIEQFTTADGQRLIAGSDRDFGLVILKYTGPGAPQRPSCADSTTATPFQASVRIPLRCTDANGNPLTRRIVGGPAKGTLGPLTGDAVTYAPRAGFSGTDSFRFVANDGAADSAPATARVNVTAPSNLFSVKLGRFSKGKVKVTVTTRAPGRLSTELRSKLRGKKASRLVRRTVSIRRAGAFSFTLKLSKARAKTLRRVIDRRRSGRLKGSVRLQWTPTGGARRTVDRSLTLRR